MADLGAVKGIEVAITRILRLQKESSGIRAVFIVGRTKGLSRFARVPEVLERLRNIVVP